jgi:hypothetical protein
MAQVAETERREPEHELPEHELPEHELVEGLRRRERAAAEALVTAYGDRVYRLALRITGNPSDAEAVVQDAFWAATRKIDTGERAPVIGRPWPAAGSADRWVGRGAPGGAAADPRGGNRGAARQPSGDLPPSRHGRAFESRNRRNPAPQGGYRQVACAPGPALPAVPLDRVHDRRSSTRLEGASPRPRGGLKMVSRACPHDDAAEPPESLRPVAPGGRTSRSLSGRKLLIRHFTRSRFPSRLMLSASATLNPRRPPGSPKLFHLQRQNRAR